MSVVEEEISLPVVTFKRQRVGNKVYLRRIVTETLDQIQNASTAQENPKFKVMASRDVIVDKLNLIKSFDVKILNTLTSEEDIEKEIIETGDFERYVQENILVIENWLKSQEEEVRSSTLHYPLEPPNLSSININSHTRLPKQQIPSFYGDPLMFQSFWEIFDSSVNSNLYLDKISKFSYLKGLLRDKSSNAILGLSLTSENYDEAVKLLKSRFGEPQIVIQTNMDVLLSLLNVESCSDILLLRKMPDFMLSFYGNPFMFQSFWEVFDSSVNSNPYLDKISKFSYLKGLLRDKSSNAVLGLSLTSENYDEAVTLLKSRFGEPQIVI